MFVCLFVEMCHTTAHSTISVYMTHTRYIRDVWRMWGIQRHHYYAPVRLISIKCKLQTKTTNSITVFTFFSWSWLDGPANGCTVNDSFANFAINPFMTRVTCGNKKYSRIVIKMKEECSHLCQYPCHCFRICVHMHSAYGRVMQCAHYVHSKYRCSIMAMWLHSDRCALEAEREIGLNRLNYMVKARNYHDNTNGDNNEAKKKIMMCWPDV